MCDEDEGGATGVRSGVDAGAGVVDPSICHVSVIHINRVTHNESFIICNHPKNMHTLTHSHIHRVWSDM